MYISKLFFGMCLLLLSLPFNRLLSMRWDTSLACTMILLMVSDMVVVITFIESTKMNRKTAEESWITLIMELGGQNVVQEISPDTSRHLELENHVH